MIRTVFASVARVDRRPITDAVLKAALFNDGFKFDLEGVDVYVLELNHAAPSCKTISIVNHALVHALLQGGILVEALYWIVSLGSHRDRAEDELRTYESEIIDERGRGSGNEGDGVNPSEVDVVSGKGDGRRMMLL